MSDAGKSDLLVEAVYGFGMILGIQVSVDIERHHGGFVPHLPLHGLHALPSGKSGTTRFHCVRSAATTAGEILTDALEDFVFGAPKLLSRRRFSVTL